MMLQVMNSTSLFLIVGGVISFGVAGYFNCTRGVRSEVIFNLNTVIAIASGYAIGISLLLP